MVMVTVIISMSSAPIYPAIQPNLAEDFAVPRFEEKAARIAEDFRLEQPCIVGFGQDFFMEERKLENSGEELIHESHSGCFYSTGGSLLRASYANTAAVSSRW
jgi:hypothetical protein